MKRYQVELKYTAYVIYEVEAETQAEAEDKAWNRMENDTDHHGTYGEWDVNLIEEMQ